MTESSLGNTDQITRILSALAATIDDRADGDPETSYTASLLQAGPLKCAKKLAEEGAELALAVAAQDEQAVADEAGDVLYHLLVALRSRSVSLNAVADALARRQGLSGLAEKAARK